MIYQKFKINVIAAVLCVMFIADLGAKEVISDQLILNAEQWEIARHGERLVKVPVLRDIIEMWGKGTNQTIELQYPGGEEGELWVEELKDWLVSLGVPENNMVAVPGSGAEDIIRFKIIRVGE